MRSPINLPVFPQFKLLKFQDKNQIEAFTRKYLPYSDFNFISLWIYNTNNDLFFSWLNNNLAIRFRDYLTKKPFYSFLGGSKVIETIDTLLCRSKKEELPEELRLIPEVSIQNILRSNHQNFSIQEDEDQNDYIISLKKTIDLSNINSHKLEAYRDFIQKYPGFEIREFDVSDKKTQGEMIKLFKLWGKQKKKTDREITEELLPLKKLFEFSKDFHLNSWGIFVNGGLIGFIIDERIKKPYVVGHFIKANLLYLGIYEVLNKVSADIHYKTGYEFINIEQDLGIQGLRVSKRQRSPVLYLKKYIIKRK